MSININIIWHYPAAAKSLQSCPTLCDPITGSPPGSSIPGILQPTTLEWGAISFFNAWKWKVKMKSLSHVQLLATPWTAAHQAPPSMGFSRQEYWSGVPFSLSSVTFIKRLVSSPLLSAIRVVSSAYLRLLIFLPAILIPACASFNPAFLKMYSAYKLNKHSDTIQTWCTPFPIGTSVLLHVQF